MPAIGATFDALGELAPAEEIQAALVEALKQNEILSNGHADGQPRQRPGPTVAEMNYLPHRNAGRSIGEIAELTGRTRAAVKKGLYRLRRRQGGGQL
jgi:hypothetical protein